jgi:site-specific recombinase XerD
MDTIYLFTNSNNSQIPFYGDDIKMFHAIASQKGVIWNSENHFFEFNRIVNAELISKAFHNIPCIQIDEGCKKSIYGLTGRAWEDEVPVKKSTKSDPIFSMPTVSRLPEKFSAQWELKLDTELRSRKYSPRTRKSYIMFNRMLCRILQKTPDEIQPYDVTQFLAKLEHDKEYCASSMNLAVSAIKFFFKNVLKNDTITDHHRPHNDKRLPVVLSKDEIAKMLSHEKNPKHRLLLMLVYSSGLRVSEVVALKREHIDISRKVIYIRLGKGRKDRSTVLAEKAAAFVEEYCEFYGIQTWLFPGQRPNRPLTIRSAQHIFDKALRCAEIPKKISIHSLRHTFATHLLESGTDIRYIQTLLGHANLRTTERYTHVARRNVLSIKSPLDSF